MNYLLNKKQKWINYMKRILTTLFVVLLAFSCNAQNAEELISRNNDIDSNKVIIPDEFHSKVNRIITTLLSRAHYRKFDLNDSLSSKVLDNYLSMLDNNKLYFIASDIEKFKQYEHSFDDFLQTGDLRVPFEIFNVYKQRVGERIDFVIKTLDKGFDFSINEEIHPDRREEPWAANVDELNDLWRKRLKNDALNQKLNGTEQEKVSDNLKKRFMSFHKTVLKYENEDVFQIYLNAFGETIEPHTNYMSPITAENFGINMSLSLEGIGAQLTSQNDYVTITRIIPGGPAAKSGKLEENDKIIGVAQGDEGEMVDVIGWRLDDVIQLIRGKKGTKVRLKIEKGGEGLIAKPFELELIRDKIKLEEQAAKSEIIEIDEDGTNFRIGVIDIPGFYVDWDGKRKGDPDYKSTTRDVKRILAELKNETVDGIIVDLRNNGGGSLQEAIELTGLFIDYGPVVQVRNNDGSVDVGTDPDDTIAYEGPLAVMVNRSSASASEIFSGAIQDYERGLIIGSQTFGKGTVQNLIDLKRFMPSQPDKLGQVKLTIAKYYRITGSSTQTKGVIPDIVFPSVYDSEEFGEGARESALPWDTIAATDFHKYENIKQFLPELVERHRERIERSAEFQYYLEDVQHAVSNRERNSYSLNEEIRKKERDEAEELRKQRDEAREKLKEIKLSGDEEVRSKKVFIDDPLLEESGRILANYISMKIG